MRTHCNLGHAVRPSGRCQTCDTLTRRRLKDRKYQDGLTPEERLDRAKRGWTLLGRNDDAA